jgi:putative transposase
VFAHDRRGLSLTRSCGLMGLPRSTFYYDAKERDDETLRDALSDVAATRRRWGYRRLLVLLRRLGFVDNHKRVFRIYQQQGLQVRRRKGRKTSKWRGDKVPAPKRANERWSMDFVQDATQNGRKIRVLNVIDDYTRECLSIEVDTSLTGARVTRVLDQIVDMRGKPDALLTDNGSEFTSRAMEKWSYSSDVKHQFIEPGKPVQNAYVESFNGKFRDECLNEHWFANLQEVRLIVEEWRIDYNEERPHSGLGYRTPAEFAAGLQEGARQPARLCAMSG